MIETYFLSSRPIQTTLLDRDSHSPPKLFWPQLLAVQNYWFLAWPRDLSWPYKLACDTAVQILCRQPMILVGSGILYAALVPPG